MPLRSSGNKQSSERDTALVQMQLAAQARNQQWHDFLCGKRDGLQARLRQQGYSERSADGQHSNSNLYDRHQHPLDPAGEQGSTSQNSTRWNAAEPEEDVRPVQPDGDQVIAPDMQNAEEREWFGEADSTQL